MRALVVYESMFGNTHHVADAIADGLRATYDVEVASVEGATAEMLYGVDLLVVGGPTHVHGLSTERSRAGAVEVAAKSDGDLEMEPDAFGEGLRQWFDELGERPGVRAAAFDTRVGSVSAVISGRASKAIAKRLAKHHLQVVMEPESFLVDTHTHLVDGELERATVWGAAIAGRSRAAVR
jgi:flavodoxin